MNVAAVQQHFRDLAVLVRAAGASAKVVADVEAVAACLQPFAGHSVGDFADFLRRADDFARTGVMPVVPEKKKPERAPRPPKPAKLEPEEALSRFRTLYDGVLSPNLTPEAIEAGLSVLDGLTKPHILKAAEHVEIAGKVKKYGKDEMLAAVKQAVRDRRGRFERPNI